MRNLTPSDQVALDQCAKLGLHPIPPLGDDHHTEEPLTEIDRSVGHALAYFLGTVAYENEFEDLSAADQWAIIARALRIHGLKIVTSIPCQVIRGPRSAPKPSW